MAKSSCLDMRGVGLVIMGILLMVVLSLAAVCKVQSTDYASDPSIQLFQKYVQIDTTSNNDLTPVVEFWTNLANEQGIPIDVYEFTSGYPVIVLTWAGTDPSLPAVMLNSHMDVVPADEADGWTYPPFAAEIDANGNIYGRGAQDNKSVGMQYFLALCSLKDSGVTLLRNIHMTLMPDEEIGGEHGMVQFLASDQFAALNIGVEFDEGTSFELPVIATFYQDKVVWQFRVDCLGTAGHSSTFLEANTTATGQAKNFLDLIYQYREEQYKIAATAPVNENGGYTACNCNMMDAGTAMNVYPAIVSMYFDCRLGTAVNENTLETQINQWLAEAGSECSITYILKDEQSPATIIDSSNPYWTALSNAANNLGIYLLPTVPPGSTDARFVRNHGIPAFGFSPMPNTPLLLHSVDEYLNADVFLQGITIYKEIINNVANIPGDQTSADSSVYIQSTSAAS